MAPRKIVVFERLPGSQARRGSSENLDFWGSLKKPQARRGSSENRRFRSPPRLQGPTWLLGKSDFPRRLLGKSQFRKRVFSIFANLLEMNRYLIHFFDVLRPEL